MTKYCITAANHDGASDHRASEFNVWEYRYNEKEEKWKWYPLGGKSLDYVAALLVKGNDVVSGKENEDSITTGAAIEIVLRIAKNDAQVKITDLPTF